MPKLHARDGELREVLAEQGIELVFFHDHVLLEPGSIKTKAGHPYKVFTPFWRSLAERLIQMPAGFGLHPLPDAIPIPSVKAVNTDLDALNLLDNHPWHKKLHSYWKAGEKAALEQLDAFVDEQLGSYPDGRNLPAESCNSKLSAALHFGEISPWRILHTLRPAYEGEWGAVDAKSRGFFASLGMERLR